MSVLSQTPAIRVESRLTVRRKSVRVRWGALLTLLVLTVGAFFMVMPLLWMFSTSMRPTSQSFSLPPVWIPTTLNFDNYAEVFRSNVPFFQFFLNSLKITLAVTIGQLLFCSTAGFAFARLRFPGRNILFILLLASLMVPTQVTVIPIFLIMRSLRLIDNPLSIILPSLVSAFGVFQLRQFFLTLPQDLLDAATIDGAGTWRTFWQVALPLARPSLAALAVITFNATWNNYFYPLIFLTSWQNMTLPQGIALLRGYMSSGNPSVVMAAVALSILPILIIFIVAQRWIVEAMARSGLKG